MSPEPVTRQITLTGRSATTFGGFLCVTAGPSISAQTVPPSDIAGISNPPSWAVKVEGGRQFAAPDKTFTAVGVDAGATPTCRPQAASASNKSAIVLIRKADG